MTPDIQQQIKKLQDEINSLKKSASIPYEVDSAFRERFNIEGMNPLASSSKVASSENQAVNEAGSASYSVLKSPDAFLQVTIGGSTYYIPVFT